jgi:hypothetical protein
MLKKQLTAADAQSILPEYTISEVRQLFPKKGSSQWNGVSSAPAALQSESSSTSLSKKF